MRQKVFVLGVGKRCQKCWLKLLLARPEIEIVGMADTDPKVRAEAVAEYPILETVRFYTSLEAFLAAGGSADFCVVCTPPQVHFGQITTLLRAGIDVLTEKPVVLTMEKGVALAETAEKFGRHFWVAQNFRFSRSAQYLREAVQTEKYGKPGMSTLNYLRDRDGSAPWLNKYPLTMEQPMLFEQSEHHYDLFRYCYGTEIQAVYGKTMNPSWSMYRHDATVCNLFETESGLLINYFGTWSAAHSGFGFQWRTDFERGVILQNSMFADMFEAPRHSEALNPVLLEPEELFVTDAGVLLDYFIRRNDGPISKEMPTIRDNLKTIALMFATLHAQKERKVIYMDEFLKEFGI